MRSSVLFLVLANALLRAGFWKSEMILLAMRLLPVCKRSVAPPQSCLPAETPPSSTDDWDVSNPCGMLCKGLPRPRTLQEKWALAYYERKRARCGKSHCVAVRALSNIWARLLLTTQAAWCQAASLSLTPRCLHGTLLHARLKASPILLVPLLSLNFSLMGF